jgi:putative addiction module component (TIGR02574 family)
MTTTDPQAVFKAALSLGEKERAQLVEQLLESLAPPTEEVSEEEFVAELERRYQEYLRDPSIAVPLSKLWDDEAEQCPR